MGIATISIAALVNVIALLGPGVRKLGDQGIVQTAIQLRGLARLYLVGSPYTSVTTATPAGSAPTGPRPVESPGRQLSRTSSRPISTEANRGLRTTRPSVQGSASGLLPRVKADVTSIRRSLPSTASTPARPKGGPNRLTSRTTYLVPQRPNRLPTSSLTFLRSVDHEPDIFAEARESMSRLPALGKRVHLLSTNPRHVALAAQSANPLPDTFAMPDLAWTTSYGRFPALRPIA